MEEDHGSMTRLGDSDHDDDNAEEAAAAPPPPICILLDLTAYITDHTDAAAATTARSRTTTGHDIELTLFASSPPLVSRILVHCPGLTTTNPTSPKILAAADGLVLLAITIGHRSQYSESPMVDYFVYSPAMASLRLLPHPDPRSRSCFFAPTDAAILPCSATGNGGYLVAVLLGTHRTYELHRFRSDGDAWTTTTLQLGAVDPPEGSTFFSHCSHKAVPLLGGGGFVGWADLWCGVLLCDVLLDDPELRYVGLPVPPTGMALLQCRGEPLLARDVAAVEDGYVMFVDHRYNNGGFDRGWMVTVWRKKIVGDPWEEGWDKVCELSDSEVVVPLSSPPLLPKPLEMLRTGHPAISLEGDDVVYFMCKDRLRDDNFWILAIDVRNKMLRGVLEFDAEITIGIDHTYYVQTRLLPVHRSENHQSRKLIDFKLD